MSKKSEQRMRRLVKIVSLEQRWGQCYRCELHKSRKQVVFWRGDPTARVTVIGEAPGAEEDSQGKPFVGDSGKVLDKALNRAGLQSNKHVFIVNILGCRPPGNNTPTSSQAKACRPRLERLIQISKPRALVLLGGTAAKRMAGIGAIGRWINEWVDVDLFDGETTIPAVPVYHPAYYLYKGHDQEVLNSIAAGIKKAYNFAWSKKNG